MACGASKFSFYIWAPFLLDLGVPRGKDATTASSRETRAHTATPHQRDGATRASKETGPGEKQEEKNAAHTPTGNIRGHGLKNLKRPKKWSGWRVRERVCSGCARAQPSPLSPPRIALPFPPPRRLSHRLKNAANKGEPARAQSGRRFVSLSRTSPY